MSTRIESTGLLVHMALNVVDVKGSTADVAYLPGLAPREGEIETPNHPPDTRPGSGWWVKRSAKQVLNAAGQPVGFRHQLMHGRVVIRSGVGADCARTFQQQAVFLNAKDHMTNDKS